MTATKLYFLWKTGGTAPSGYTKVTDWNGRYLKLTNAILSHGATGGNLKHSHTLSNWSCSDSAQLYEDDGGSGGAEGAHAHGLYTTSGETNNDPPYITYELLSIDLATWEGNHKNFPSGAILLSSESLSSWNEVVRETNLDGKLIKIDTAGGSGGRTTATNTINVTTTTVNPSTTYDYRGNDTTAIPHAHSHIGSGTSDSQTTFPLRIQTRIYSCPADTSKAIAGVICFVDGTPSANWDNANLTGFVEGADSNATLVGSNAHSHAAMVVTSSTQNDSPGLIGYLGTEYGYPNKWYIGDQSHNHQLGFTPQSADHQPPYVQLYAVKLNTTLTPGGLRCSIGFI